MTPKFTHIYLVRVVLEAKTPLSIASGQADGVFDVALVRDANGLPAIPGSSIAGVLRHLYWSVYGEAEMKALFGWQEADQGDPSRLHVSWGAIQDSQGRPVEGLLLGKERTRIETDPLLHAAWESAATPFNRDRVRVSHRGVAADKAKFDRAVLPAGYRFSAEISLVSEQARDPRWDRLIGLFAHPLFRVGGATRAGLGRLVPKKAFAGRFDLATPEGRAAFSALPPGLGESQGLKQVNIESNANDGRYVSAVLRLKPRAFWRIGQGESGRLDDDNGKTADLLPKLEPRVVWKDGKWDVAADELLVPASSVKGALAHRVAFHANCLAGRWAEGFSPEALKTYDKSEECEEARTLFGFARDDRGGKEGDLPGQAGRVFIDDAFVQYTKDDLQLMIHNSIDRFTGGVREHMLFTEELVWGKEVELALAVDTQGIDEASRCAFALALEDLCSGRLALGGGAAKGHGFFDGKIKWFDDAAWIGDGKPRKEAA